MSSPPVISKRQRLKNFFKGKPLASSSSTGPHESAPSDSPQQSHLSENLKISGSFARSILPKIAGCIDENPAKMAFNILNVIMEVRKEINDNKDELQRVLEETLMLLSTVLAKMETGSNAQSVVDQTVEQYKREVGQNLEQIKILNDRLTSSLVTQFDYENYKEQLTDISRKIGGATNRFNTAMAGTTGIMVDELRDNKREEKLRKDLQPSAMADHRFIHEGQSALKRETCTDGTRVRILDEIAEWANDSSVDSPSVFWLTGQAGAGKTTIAYTIVKRFVTGQATILGASFFCSRQFGETRSLQRVVPTIVYQLAHECKTYRAALNEVETSDAVHYHGVEEQFVKFLFQPWMKRKHHHVLPTYLVVVDALDEIENMERSSFLEQLLKSLKKGNITGLKFLVTSRPDPDIVELCKTFPPGAICQLQNVSIEDAKQDIKIYLDVKLTRLNGTPEFDKLNEESAGLFIYAATAVKILTGRKLAASEQLKRLRSLLSSTSSALDSIDQLYQQIMIEAFAGLNDEPELLSIRLCILYTFLCSAERISPSIVATLLDTDIEVARIVLDNLHAVLYVQDGKVFWYHASFPDFIFSRARANFLMNDKKFTFSCDVAAQHGLLAHACFRIMNSKEIGLQFNMGNIKSSYLLDREHAEELREDVNKNVSPALRYACMYWVHHVSSSPTANDGHIYDVISDFLQIRVLFWIEAMNLLDSSGESSYLLHDAGSWVSKGGYPGVVKDLQEVAHFAAYFAGCPAAESTPHLYISSLATWQSVSNLLQSWKKKFLRIPVYKHTGGILALPIMTKRINGRISAIAFSNDGKQVVAGMMDSAVVLDAATGRQQHVLNVEQSEQVKFSRDGTRLVIVSSCWGSKDYLVRTWDTSTFHLVKEFSAFQATISIEGTEILTISDVHPNGYPQVQVLDISTGTLLWTGKMMKFSEGFLRLTIFSSASRRFLIELKQSVEIWDISSEYPIKTATIEDCNVQVISLSPDGKLVVVGLSENYEAKVFDASTGYTLFVLPHNHVVEALDFSYDGTRVVSASYDGTLYVWDTATGARLKVLDINNVVVSSVVFTRDGLRIGLGSDEAVYVWSFDESAQVECHTENDGFSYTTRPGRTLVAISDDSSKIMSFNKRDEIKIWDATIGTELMATSNPDMFEATLSGTGENIVCSLNNGSVKVLNTATGDEILYLESEANTDTPVWVASSRSGRKFALIRDTKSKEANSKRIEIWDVESASKEVQFVIGEFNFRSSLYFSDDEHYIVGDFVEEVDEGVGGCITVCDLLTGNFTQKIEVKIYGDGRLFSSNGKEFAVCSVQPLTPNTTLGEVWDIPSGKRLRIFKAPCRPQSHDNEKSIWIHCFSLSNNGKKIVAACSDGFVRIWSHVSDESTVEMLVGYSRIFSSITFARDDKLVVTGSWSGSVQVWDLDLDAEKFLWTQQNNGWITLRNTEHRLMWVSDMLKVIQPRNTVFISGNGHGSVDFSVAMIGEEWEKCYSP